MRKHILITNDDGIESRFLHAIAHALEGEFDLSIAAPKRQQSWIGRAVTRRGIVSVERHPELPWQAWTIDGTPTDCVNIALGNLLDCQPDAVVSGINIGYNTTTQLIYSPAVAVSQEIPDEIFFSVADNDGILPAEWQSVLEDHAAHAAGLIRQLVEEHTVAANPVNGTKDAVVHNLNYPARPRQPLQLVRTVPAPFERMAFFHSTGNGGYDFKFQHGRSIPAHAQTDREALALGHVSHSILNFSDLGRDLNH